MIGPAAGPCGRRRGKRTTRITLAFALAALAPIAARAQSACAVDIHASARRWQSPLDRSVTLDVRGVTMRDALDQIAAGARIRLSYSSELVPLDRRVCATLDSVTAGDALTTLLHDIAFEPIVAGDDQVVLAPARRAEAAVIDQPELAASVGVLDRVLVTSRVSDPQRGTATAATVVGKQQLTRGAPTSMSDLLDAAVPGLWLWNQAPSSLLGSYGSIRGASSFGISYPKMYIDGIEVANPLLVTRLDPELVERIDVIRGPQGAALYGADAISGVVNVVTRHDGVDASGDWLRVHSDAGLSESSFSPAPVLAQEHGVLLRGGTMTRTGTLGVSAQTIGNYIPNAGSSEVRAIGGVRLLGTRSTITGTARFFAKNAGSPANPLLAGLTMSANGARWDRRGVSGPSLRPDTAMGSALSDSGPQSVRQYTLGATMTLAQSERLTHSFVAGVDGYRLDNATNGIATLPSSPDAALRAASGAADRTTLRASSSLQLGGEGRAAGSVTVTAEHSLLREQTVAGVTTGGRDSLGRSTWWATSGLVGEASASIDDAWYATGGVRLEQDGGSRAAVLPMLGTAYVRDFGVVTTKVRTAYGRGLRPARTAVREAAWLGVRNLNSSELAPEEQSGVEAGADLFVGRALAVHVTRFDQRAYGLIQPVALMSETVLMTGMPSRMGYRLQNVGEIANRGWELQSTLGIGRLSLSSALSLVDSRVTRVDEGYTGDLRAGDRMLGVPARTASVTAGYNASRWTTSWSLSRASDWMNYDRLAIANALSTTTTTVRGIAGPDLRLFWREYSGVTHLRGSFTRDLARRWSVTVTGENLLNEQQGEPDDLSVMPGRTLSFGLRARF